MTCSLSLLSGIKSGAGAPYRGVLRRFYRTIYFKFLVLGGSVVISGALVYDKLWVITFLALKRWLQIFAKSDGYYLAE